MAQRAAPGTARRFKATETTTVRDLQVTMRNLAATSLRISARNLLDPKDAACEIIFDRSGRRYAIRCQKWRDYLDNLRAAERIVYYLYRAIEEYGVTAHSNAKADPAQAFLVAFEVLPDDPVLALPSGKHGWWQVLGVEPDAPEAAIVNAYRALALRHHPDAGGDQADWRRINEAYQEARRALRERRPAA